MLLTHSICLRACKICVVFVEMKLESNSRKLRKVPSTPQDLWGHLYGEDSYFTGSGKKIPLHEIVVKLGIKVEFWIIPVSFLSFFPFQLKKATKVNNKWMGRRRKSKWPTVIYWPSTEPSIKRCTCANKQKKSGSWWELRKNVDRVPAAVGHSGTGCQSENQLADWGLCDPQGPPVEKPRPRCERSAAVVERGTRVNIAVRPCLHSSFTHNRTSPFRK